MKAKQEADVHRATTRIDGGQPSFVLYGKRFEAGMLRILRAVFVRHAVAVKVALLVTAALLSMVLIYFFLYTDPPATPVEMFMTPPTLDETHVKELQQLLLKRQHAYENMPPLPSAVFNR